MDMENRISQLEKENQYLSDKYHMVVADNKVLHHKMKAIQEEAYQLINDR